MANPLGQILAAAMLLDHLGEAAAGDGVRAAVRAGLAGGAVVINPDGTARGGAAAVGGAVAGLLPAPSGVESA